MALVQFPQNLVSRSIFASGTTGLSGGANSIVLNGPTIPAKFVGDACAAHVVLKLFTNNLAVSVKWQVQTDDGATWVDALESYNPARVALSTGAGTSGGTTYEAFLSAPASVIAGNRPARAVILGSGSATGAGGTTDTASISYDFRAPVSPYNG